jgi:hypothetical protein
MGTTLRIIFLCLIFTFVMKMQLNYDSDQTSTRYLKDSLELAVHDAAMVLDTTQFGKGDIVFDQDLSMFTLRQTLEQNLKLDHSLQPTNDSFFQDDVKIVYTEFIDNSTFSGIYPLNYSNPTYDILETITGPSMVVVLETKSPRHFVGEKQTIRQAVVYQYRDLPN